MATKYLDTTGLTYLWSKIKSWAKRFLVNSIGYDTTNKKITYVKYDGTNDAEHSYDVVTAATIVVDGGGLTSHQTVDNKNATLAWNTQSTIATIGSTDIKVTMPANPDTDTKNTAGSTDSSSKLFIVGATTQDTNPQTYSQDSAYVGTDGHLYSNSVQAVNLSDTQALTNKTYNGLTLTKATTGFTVSGGTTSKTLTVNETYTLGAACAKGVDSSITEGSTSVNVPTTAAVESRIASAIQSAQVGAAMFQGTVNTGTDISGLTAYSKGWYWIIGTAGTYVGQSCEAGDMIYCVEDFSSAYSASDFSVIQKNLDLESITTSEIDSITSN